MKLLYFAWVRQRIGKAEENLERPSEVTTIAELAAYLHSRGEGYAKAFADPVRLRAARNQEHASFDAPVSDEDEIAFFPPVTGG
ncbi:MAG TPA: molybdopterin converting factor subunit 1 [Rhizomicrobium sp.]